MNDQGKKHEVDAWTNLAARKAKYYRDQGLTAEEAEERAVNDIRREIRSSPPIRHT